MTFKLPEFPKNFDDLLSAYSEAVATGGEVGECYLNLYDLINADREACAKAALEEAIKLAEKYNDGRYANCADLIAGAIRQLSDEIT